MIYLVNKKSKKTSKNLKNKGKKSKFKKNEHTSIFLAAIVVLTIVGFVLWQQNTLSTENGSDVAAIVNGQVITVDELNLQYSRLPEQYKIILSKEDFLDSLISSNLLLQEAENEGITISQDEADSAIESIKEAEFLDNSEDFDNFLSEINMDLREFEQTIKAQLMVNKLLSEKIDPTIEVTESMVQSFYERYKEELNNASFDDVKDYAKEALKNQLRDSAIQLYVKQLRAKSIIQIGGKEETENTFEETQDKICLEDGKPVIRLFSISTSEHCQWVEEVFDSVVKEYVDNGQIVAYHWQLDKGDNMLTKEVEKGIPKSEIEIFNKYSPKGAVPAFVFGCGYKRVGNGYESDNNLVLEGQEFRDLINTLIN